MRTKPFRFRLDDDDVLAVQATPATCPNTRRIPENDHAIEVTVGLDSPLLVDSPELLIESSPPAKFLLPKFQRDR
jgi:hypothetical protein